MFFLYKVFSCVTLHEKSVTSRASVTMAVHLKKQQTGVCVCNSIYVFFLTDLQQLFFYERGGHREITIETKSQLKMCPISQDSSQVVSLSFILNANYHLLISEKNPPGFKLRKQFLANSNHNIVLMDIWIFEGDLQQMFAHTLPVHVETARPSQAFLFSFH